jgi:hypothetical protein
MLSNWHARLRQRIVDKWPAFWTRVLSPQTARFVLALFAQTAAVGVTVYVMRGGVDASLENAMMFALGQLFTLAGVAYNYYFGSTARNDEKPVQAEIINQPVHVEESGDVDR